MGNRLQKHKHDPPHADKCPDDLKPGEFMLEQDNGRGDDEDRDNRHDGGGNAGVGVFHGQ